MASLHPLVPVHKLTFAHWPRQLVESPTFNTLVHNTQGTISAFLDGIDEGRRQKESSEVKRKLHVTLVQFRRDSAYACARHRLTFL